MKLQASLEYLNTYIWAVLIIAIAFVVMVELNVFNPNFWAAKQQPGSCTILRIQLGGATLHCTGSALIPEYVAQFNGQTSYITLPSNTPFNYGSAPSTICGWANLFGIPGSYGANDGYSWIMAYGTGANSEARFVGFRSTAVDGGGYGSDILYYTSISKYLSNWNFFCSTYDGSNAELYVNGALVAGPSPFSWSAVKSAAYIGKQVNSLSEYFYGQLSDIQVYNTSLSANNIQSLYLEGIGGPPINLRYLAGWWPLNGDTSDYSGNGNNGIPTNIIFTGSWYSNYVKP